MTRGYGAKLSVLVAAMIAPSICLGLRDVSAASAASAVVAAATAAGDLDSGFGSGGIVTSDLGGADLANAVAIQTDGKIVAAGASAGGFTLVRYTSDGSVDPGFGSGGVVTTFFRGGDGVQALVIQPDGKIVAAGSAGGFGDFALARYNPADGSLDATFGSGGKVTTSFPGRSSAFGVAVQADGKIVAAGQGDGGYFDLARYNPDGSPDTTFGTGGLVMTAIDGSATSVAIQADGKIVAAGGSTSFTSGDFRLARYKPDGSLDTGFGTGGKVTTDFGLSDSAIDLAIQSDGKLIAAGMSLNFADPSVGGFALARYGSDGSLDPGFGTGGKVVTGFSVHAMALAVALQADGSIVAAGGSSRSAADTAFTLARYKADGTLDSGFGSAGRVTTDVTPGLDNLNAVALQADGKIVGAGLANDDFAVARYLAGEVTPPDSTADNRALDANLETNPASYYFSNGPCAFSWASDQAHSPSHSLKISSSTGALCRWLSMTTGANAIPVVPGTAYDVSAWLRTDGSNANGGLSVNFWTAAGVYVPATVDAPQVLRGAQPWSAARLLLTVPIGAAFMRVEFRLTGPGTLWADDVRVSTLAPEPPSNTSLPAITGSPQAGSLLSASVGTWTGSPGFAFQWQAANTDIPGATAASYLVTNGDVGKMITVRVTATNAGGSTSALSASVGPVIAQPHINLVANPDVELNPDAAYYTNGSGVFSWATDAAHSPTHSLKLVSAQPSGSIARWMTRTPVIPVTPGTAYDVSAWLKTQNVNHGDAQLVVTFWNAAQAYIAGSAYASAGTVTGTADWTLLTLAAKAPVGAAFMRVEFRLTGPGTMWADDVGVRVGAGPVPFSDDFTNGETGDWTFFNRYGRIASGRLWIDGGYMPNSVGRGGWALTHIGDTAWTDYALDVTYNNDNVGGSPDRHMAAISFRVSETSYPASYPGTWYEVLIWDPGNLSEGGCAPFYQPSPNGWVQLQKFVNGVVSAVLNVCSSNSTNGTNTAHIEVRGNTIDVMVNGQAVLHYEDPAPILSGGIGLGKIWETTGWYDDVIVRALN